MDGFYVRSRSTDVPTTATLPARGEEQRVHMRGMVHALYHVSWATVGRWAPLLPACNRSVWRLAVWFFPLRRSFSMISVKVGSTLDFSAHRRRTNSGQCPNLRFESGMRRPLVSAATESSVQVVKLGFAVPYTYSLPSLLLLRRTGAVCTGLVPE